MLIPGIIGFQTLFFFFVFLFCLWLHHKWRNAVARKEEIRRLVDLVSKESALVEFEAVYEYSSFPKPHQCAVCFCPTTTRCSQCKSVHYCSGKCQIVHWRRGHKDQCRPLTTAMHLKLDSEFCERSSEKQSEMHVLRSELLANVSTNKQLGYSCTGRSETPSEDVLPDIPCSRASSEEMQETKLPPPKSNKTVTYVNSVSRPSKLNKVKPSYNGEAVDGDPQLPNGKVMSDDVRPAKSGNKKFMKKAALPEMLVTDSAKCKGSTSLSSLRLDSVTDDGEDDSQVIKGKHARSLSSNASGDHSRDASNGLKNSVWRKVQQLKMKQSHSHERIFPYELFEKLYSCDEELSPFGLRNCGNSCYANTVLQCLAFTRPLTSYFVRRKKEWCFICEFESLILKAREGESPLSPIRILSKIEKIGSHLGHGKEEDAHEFLRYAVDTMQSVCLKEAGALGVLAEETTLVGLTFGGYLRSKITCMKCFGKSERFERIMDLTVEIDGDIDTLEEALMQFTACEMLDGGNKYICSRCKSYVKAKKKLSLLEAPNILTIVLKRFQSGNFGKLNKSVRFPEVLDMAPYMCGKSDKSPQYSLYAVVVHRDMLNDTSTGHYVCYIKTSHGEWFGVNDSIVMPVELERVLLEEAYMLLYARHHPRAPSVLKSNVETYGVKLEKRNLEAVPSSLNTSKAKSKSKSHFPTADPSKPQLKHGKYPYRMTPDDSISNKLLEPDDWRFHLVDSSSESSSLFSWSDASSCSTASTKGSVKSEDFSDFLFGEAGPGWCGHGHCGLSSDAAAPPLYRNGDADLHRRKDSWRQPPPQNDWR
ncbi:ubiquitin carboxyl-terminal hydrolase 17 isoform X2 [Jatropha curcas]|uniref:ubiquitin carboxyl-terminal hydrolase 17 isoform X2 n=1 Tax=Jatropha curcas TaxID=180498 RepID=UPI0005FA96A7|nr:ubiquitin carboxyl-terminal hydrolase 17 isoform X2 [Jatropha curcas]